MLANRSVPDNINFITVPVRGRFSGSSFEWSLTVPFGSVKWLLTWTASSSPSSSFPGHPAASLQASSNLERQNFWRNSFFFFLSRKKNHTPNKIKIHLAVKYKMYVIWSILKIVFWLLINYRDPTPLSTPEHVRDAVQQDDHEQRERLMESPQNRRVPDPLPVNQQFNYLHPANLAQMRDNLPPLIPGGWRGRRRQPPVDPAPAPDFALGPAFAPAPAPDFALAPAFAPDPAPAPAWYQYIPADLAQQVAALVLGVASDCRLLDK